MWVFSRVRVGVAVGAVALLVWGCSTQPNFVAKGIVINGLPIVLKPGGAGSMFDLANLDHYYAQCVIGGPGSFMIPIREKSEFATATRQKLLLEIAGLEPEPTIIRVQAAPKIDCMVGEQLWRQYFDDRIRE